METDTDKAIAELLALPAHDPDPAGPSNALIGAAIEQTGELSPLVRGSELVRYVLRVAAELLADSERWTTGYYVTDENHQDLQKLNGPTAACWCAEGAVYAVVLELFDRQLIGRRDLATSVGAKACSMLQAEIAGYYRAENPNTPPYLTGWNDDAEHGQVVQLFDDTIARTR
jgi:hypothetical protein